MLVDSDFSNKIFFLDLWEDYWSWSITDYTESQTITIYNAQEVVSNYSEYINEVIPNVYDRTQIPDFMNLDSSPCIFGDSFRYTLSQCDVSLPSYSSDKPLYQPKFLSGLINVIVYKNNSVVSLIDFWLGTQFAN